MNAVATIENKLPEVTRFELMQREAKMFAMSPLVPAHLRQGTPEQALANCYIALHMAKAMNENPIMTMQNIYIVSGKAGWAAKYMIARANASGRFKGGIDWRIEGSGDSLKATAYAVLSDTGQEVSAEVSMEMAKAEGWTRNTKYKTMPEVMLRYRSATFLVNFYCPEVMMGYQTVEELEDMAAGSIAEPAKSLTATAILEQAEENVIDAEVEDVTEAQGDPDTNTEEQQATEAATEPQEAQKPKETPKTQAKGNAMPDVLEVGASDDAMKLYAGQISTYLKACKNTDQIDDLLLAHDDSLRILKTQSPKAYDHLMMTARNVRGNFE